MVSRSMDPVPYEAIRRWPWRQHGLSALMRLIDALRKRRTRLQEDELPTSLKRDIGLLDGRPIHRPDGRWR